MIITAILSSRYNIPQRVSRILNHALNLLINSIISSSGGPPTPAFHIPQDLSTIFENLQLELVIQNYICCPQCFFLNGLTESVTTDQPHCQCHNDPNDHDPPCTQSLGKFINQFEPHTQNTTNMKQKFIPTKNFIYQPFKNWLARFLQQAGIMNIHNPPFMSITDALAFSIYVDWFNAHGKSTRLASIGPIMLICLNLPPSERLKPENVYVAGIITGPKEPTALQLNYLLMPLIKELKKLWQGYHFSATSTGNHFCNFCTIHEAQIEEIGPQFHYTRSYQNHKSTISEWLQATPKQQQASFSEYGVQYSILEDLPYWEATRMVNIHIMHNLILGILKDHEAFKLCIPESKSKIYFRSRRKSNDTNSSDSYSMTCNSSLEKITLRKARSLRRDTAKMINESLPTTSTQKNYLTIPTPHTQNTSSGSADIPSFDAHYIPTSEIPSELDISALSDHQIKGEALEHL
ncbi:hypothetical protein O181_062981 [Austropuccinia psidii MF-1]|uniref:Transposase domain-containing protein n=1 Tax=Austropuccinia psidii MF-1 TaxID=1389203 RepID=A0A9Q3EQU3_9BASI|nr:hypothetical protein [Austropuccinia psidii MF-1]